MWLILAVYIGSYSHYTFALNGSNVCPEEERFTANFTQLVLRKFTSRNYKWCLNIPPRCSYYTEGQRYIQEVVKKEEVRLVNKCCPGFKEDNGTSTCIFDCSVCTTDDCKFTNLCSCPPGFHGPQCDLACPNYFWGSNCVEKCSCIKGDCSPVTGYCSCPPGWKGNRCEEENELYSSKLSSNSTITSTVPNNNIITPDWNTFVKSLTKQSDRAHYPAFQKYLTFVATTHASQSNLKIESDSTKFYESSYPLSISVLERGPTLESYTQKTTEIHNSSVFVISSVKNGTETITEPIATQSIIQESRTKQNQSFVNNSLLYRAISVTQASNVIVKEKVTESIGVSVTGTQTVSSESSWLNNQSTIKIDNTKLSTHPKEVYNNNSHLIFSIGAAIGILATILVIIAVTFLKPHNYKNCKTSLYKNKNNQNLNGGLSAVAIYTRSVFDGPQPEVPALEDTVFATPLGSRDTSNTIQTHLICSMHLQNEVNFKKDTHLADEFYDHPPSTGSYRAASIPEPPDQKIVLSESNDHLYDEIPCWKQTTENNNGLSIQKYSYYANSNTCTRNS